MNNALKFKSEEELVKAMSLLKNNNINFNIKTIDEAIVDNKVNEIENKAFNDGYTISECEYIGDIFRVNIEQCIETINKEKIDLCYKKAIKEFELNRRTIA